MEGVVSRLASSAILEKEDYTAKISKKRENLKKVIQDYNEEL